MKNKLYVPTTVNTFIKVIKINDHKNGTFYT